MGISIVNFKEKFSKIKELHAYKLIAQMNNYHFKLVRVKREFIWHQHPETDEAFIIIEGTLTIELRDQVLQLGEGEMVVIPRGIEHKPSCIEECKILLIEPEDTVNTGTTGGKLTDMNLEWV